MPRVALRKKAARTESAGRILAPFDNRHEEKLRPIRWPEPLHQHNRTKATRGERRGAPWLPTTSLSCRSWRFLSAALRPSPLARFCSVYSAAESITKAVIPVLPHLYTGKCLISSIKGKVKKKHSCNGRNFSCFGAHMIEQDLF